MKEKRIVFLENYDDGELIQVEGDTFLVVGGFATEGQLGIHNEYNTQFLVSVWSGEDVEWQEADYRNYTLENPDWKSVGGFNIESTNDKNIESEYNEKLLKVIKHLK